MCTNTVTKTSEICPCGSGRQASDCCERFFSGALFPATPEELMRSRYTAYVRMEIDYLVATTLPEYRRHYPKKALAKWAASCTWLRLTVLDAFDDQVKFTAVYQDESGKLQEHREWSFFTFREGRWYYKDGNDF